jgi:sRNA-binding carbon storage regulator CsrA
MLSTAGPRATLMAVVVVVGTAVPIGVAAPEEEELCGKEIYSE